MSLISEVKQRTDIVEVISAYVPLQKAGRNFKALCPFHSEKHPSFFVFPEQQTWHCFGACGTGGDVFSFIMKKEGIDFSQALRLLAQRAGIALGPPEMPSKPEDKKKERLFQINEVAAEYYHHLLLNTRAGETARTYLSNRKLTLETIKGFRLGFSPDSWEILKGFLIGKGYEERELIEAGVAIEKEGGGSYDRFRNRLMFPICNIQGRVIGFGARALDESLPKYVNSAQTLIFDKSSCLYGIDKAKSSIRQRNLVIIVEGYMDALAAHQHGWQNTVASMGTSITEKQIAVIKKLSKNITLALDADAAGEEATLRGADLLARSLGRKATGILSWSRESALSLHRGEAPNPALASLVEYQSALDAEIKVILLPRDKDPDEVISENPHLWQELVEQALPLLDFAFEAVIGKVDFTKAKDKALAIENLLPLIYEIKDPVEQDQYIRKLASILKVSKSALNASLTKLQLSKARQQSAKITEQHRPAYQLVSNPIEEYCLALLLQYPELRPLTQELSAEHFECTENRQILIDWRHSRDISELKEKFDAELLEHLNYLMAKPVLDKNDRERRHALSDCILNLQERLSKRLEAGRELIFNLTREKEGVNAELAKLDEQGIGSSEQLKEIFTKREKSARTKEIE
jgi:DNA primase